MIHMMFEPHIVENIWKYKHGNNVEGNSLGQGNEDKVDSRRGDEVEFEAKSGNVGEGEVERRNEGGVQTETNSKCDNEVGV